MTQSQFAMLREYSDRIEAETIRIRLAAAGIQAFVTGTDAATALGLGGAATMRMVQVKVPRADHPRATALLEEDRRRMIEAGPWICSRCAEQNEAAFEVCWSCSKPRREEDKPGRIDETSSAGEFAELGTPVQIQPPFEPSCAEDNPYRPVMLERDSHVATHDLPIEATEALSEAATRCFRAAITGAIVFPPLVSFYGVFLLLTVDRAAYRDRRMRRKLLIAWCINLANIPLWMIFWLNSLI